MTDNSQLTRIVRELRDLGFDKDQRKSIIRAKPLEELETMLADQTLGDNMAEKGFNTMRSGIGYSALGTAIIAAGALFDLDSKFIAGSIASAGVAISYVLAFSGISRGFNYRSISRHYEAETNPIL